MATYLEIRQLFNDSDLTNKITVAVVIAANDLLSGTPTAAQKSWAASVFSSPSSVGKQVLMAVLADKSGVSVANITGATDAVIQTTVDGVAQSLVDAFAGV